MRPRSALVLIFASLLGALAIVLGAREDAAARAAGFSWLGEYLTAKWSGFSDVADYRNRFAGEVDFLGATTACVVAQSEVMKRVAARDARFPSCRDNPWQVQSFANLSWLVKSSVDLPDASGNYRSHKFEVSVRRNVAARNLEWQASVLSLE